MITNPTPVDQKKLNKLKKIEELRKNFRMTPAYEILLVGTPMMPIGLLHLQVARADQLGRPHYSEGSIKAVKAKLYDLEVAGYVQFDAIPTKFTKSPYVYMLTKKGINFLAQEGYDVNLAYRPDKDNDRHVLFLNHTLEVNDVIIAAAMLKKANPNFWLEHFIHERVWKHRPYSVNWNGGEIRLIPDGLLTFRYRVSSGERRTHLMLEHESSEKGQLAFRRKVRAYIELLKGELRDRGITIAYTTTLGPRYLGKMREWTWQELHNTGEPDDLGRMFLFASIQKPVNPEQLWLQNVWYSPYDEQPITMFGG